MDYLLQNYKENLAVLQEINSPFYERLSALDGNSNLELIQGKSPVDFNVKNTNKELYLYDNVMEAIEKELTELDEYSEYPYLYIYGIGTGVFAFSLLKNTALKRLVVFEPDIEMMFIALHLWNFKDKLLSGELSFQDPDSINFASAVTLCNDKKAKLYVKVYELIVTNDYYYTVYEDEIKTLNDLLIQAFEHIIINAGNSVDDALLGVEHHVYNLKHMLNGPSFQENFIHRRNSETMILVSSGPSLGKQLPHLKEIQDYATIICAESALKILELNGIKPDICVSLERIPEVVKSFENVSDEYKNDVIFVRASLQHKDVEEVLADAEDVLVMRPFEYNRIFELDNYGYLGAGTSVANIAHELAIYMGFKTCIIIGQDLSYADDGSSHTKGHNFGTEQNKLGVDDEIVAYGGKGKVKTHYIWKLFLRGLIQTIYASKDRLLTINSTEGGARIDGAVEIPFKEATDKYLLQEKKKEKFKLIYPDQETIDNNLDKAKKVIDTIVEEGEAMTSKLEEAFLVLRPVFERLDGKPLDEQVNVLSDAEIMEYLREIENMRDALNKNEYFARFYYELAQSNIVHTELELSRIKVLKVHNAKENKEKAVQWIYYHMYYFFSMAGFVQSIIDVIKRGNPFKEEMK